MKKILIATHGCMAEGVKSSIKILAGMADSISCINAYMDESDYTEQILAFVDGVEAGDSAVIFTDLYGGSVNQRVVRYLPKDKTIHLIIGFNLGLVLEIALAEEPLTEEGIDEIVRESKKQMGRVPIPQLLNQKTGTNGEFFE